VNVGIVGCGVIAARYAEHAGAFDAFGLVACADVSRHAREALARAHGLEALTVDELLADPAVDAVLNLTPATAHAAVISSALAAGKHVYSEKPLATTAAEAAALVTEAARRGLRVGCAPDTFLGSPYQTALGLIGAGAIGVPLAVSAAMLTGGQSTWHENPDIFYVDGAGPLLDMGPYYLTAIVALLGPVRRVTGFASTRVSERAIELGPRAGERFTASTPTHTAATLELDDGVTASLVASFEATTERVKDFTIHGTEGSLALPDPNTFAGPLRLRRDGGEWHEIAFESRGPRDTRGLGLQDMAEAIAEGRAHRASDRLAHHVVEVARAILEAAATGTTIDLATDVERPAPIGAPGARYA
jgi:predicted dehydrogenase